MIAQEIYPQKPIIPLHLVVMNGVYRLYEKKTGCNIYMMVGSAQNAFKNDSSHPALVALVPSWSFVSLVTLVRLVLL